MKRLKTSLGHLTIHCSKRLDDGPHDGSLRDSGAAPCKNTTKTQVPWRAPNIGFYNVFHTLCCLGWTVDHHRGQHAGVCCSGSPSVRV